MYWLLIILASLASLWAASNVQRSFRTYNKIPNAKMVSGAELAAAISRQYNLGVDVQRSDTPGLSDHYDPRSRVISLSGEVYDGRSIAAAAIAAHEMGHALQHAEGYKALVLRNQMFPLVAFASNTWMWLFMIGALLLGNGMGGMLMWAGILLFMGVVAFQLITLPVELNASDRAMRILSESAVISPDQTSGAKKMLSTAAFTYVIAAVASIAQLLYLLGMRRD